VASPPSPSPVPVPGLPGAAVAGWGIALPEGRLTNDDLTGWLDTSDEWIVERTGIRERRIAAPGRGETTGPLAVRASRLALDRAGLTPADMDLVVVATTTPERPIPSTASMVAAELGTQAGGFDLNAACAGFVYALTTVAGLLGVGAARTVLLVGVDTMSSVVDQHDRGTAILFGDGAAAMVLTSDPAHGVSAQPTLPGLGGLPGMPGLVASDLMHDPDGVELLVVDAGGAGMPATAETVAANAHKLRMDGREVFRRAVRGVTVSVQRTLERAGCSPEDVTLFVPHQANARIVDAVLARTGLSAERTSSTIDRFGNTSAGSIPIALAEAADTGTVRSGDLVLLCGFGAGLTVGTALWRWGTPTPSSRNDT
jgi:3-oxoacyl-[acyl-carrier-protein] synthase III